jgi:hypothetical protein
MVDSILRAVGQIKADVAGHLKAAAIEGICHELNYTWRERILGPVTTVQAFLLQVLCGNTACDHVPHLVGKRFTGEAYAQARARLPLALFERLLWAVCDTLKAARDQSAAGAVIAFGFLTAQVARCPIRPPCKPLLANPADKRWVAVFRWRIC